MFANVIVGYDGTLPARAALAPAADLAWRCGAHLVVVNNSAVSDEESKAAIKSRAMSLSGADIEFWVDAGADLGDALVRAAAARGGAVICLALPPRGGLLHRSVLSGVAQRVLRDTHVPVLVVGPRTDTSLGLPLVELVVALDGSPESEATLATAADLAAGLKLGVEIVGVDVGDGAVDESYLRDQVADLTARVPQVTYRLLTGRHPSTAIVDHLDTHRDAVVVLGRRGRGGGRDLLGSTAEKVVAGSPCAAILVAPTD